MARPRTGDKPSIIRQATVAEVAAVGAASASVNAIAKRAGLAVGTLYRYHPSKSALLQSIYMAIKADIHHALMDAAGRGQDASSQIRGMWFALLDYSHEHPGDFLYAEVILNAAILSAQDRARVQQMADDMTVIIRAGITDGTLAPNDPEAVRALLVAPALHLGRQSAVSGKPPDRAHAQNVFNLCWRGICNSPNK